MAGSINYAKFPSQASAEAKCKQIAEEMKDVWNGRADTYAVPLKQGRHYYVPVLPGYARFFEGLKLQNLE